MTPRRRILLTVAGLAAAIAATAGSIRWELAAEPVRQRLERALQRDMGYRLASLGSASFSAFPWPTLQLTGLELVKGGASNETASVPLAKARLNLAAWLSGDPKITALSLFEPRIRLRSSDRMEETEAVAAVVTNYLKRERRPDLANLRVQAADVLLDGQNWLTGLSINVTNVAGRDLRLTASGAYRGQPLRLTALAAPAAGATARPITWDLDVGDLSATFTGMLIAPPALDAEGRISIALGAGALRSRPLSLSREAAGLLDGVSIIGEGRLALPQLVLRNVAIERGPHRMTGAIDMTLSAAGPRLAATLHADQFDVSPLVHALADAAAPGRGRATPVGKAWMHLAQADVRFSARRLTMPGVRLDDAAFSAKLGGGRFDFALNDAKLAGASVKWRVSMADKGDGVELRSAGHADNVDLGAYFRARGGASSAWFPSGLASGQFNLEASGRSTGELLQRLTGRGQASIRNGEFVAVDVDRFLRRSDAQAPPPNGRTPFQSLDFGWRLDGGVASFVDGRLRGAGWQGRIEGTADIGRDALDILARLVLDGPENRREERSLMLRGPLAAPSPSAAPPAERRSGATNFRQRG